MSNNNLTKMASFKILLVVALVAFIGSTDAALKCMDKAAGKTKDCGADKKSCVITGTITMTGPKPTGITVTKKECATKDLDGATKLFVPPAEIKADAEVSFFCIADDCNKEKEIKDILKEDDGPKTLLLLPPLPSVWSWPVLPFKV